jgi:putative endonuclease
MYFIYILYSVKADKYYVGYSADIFSRIEQHNNSSAITFTSKHRPWTLKAAFRYGHSEAEVMKMEKFIKKQKSRKLIEKLCRKDFVPDGKLAPLVRVPHVRG